MSNLAEDSTPKRSLENPEEFGDMLPHSFFINKEGKRTTEKKRIEKKTSQFFWEQKVGTILFLIFIISSALLVMLMDWLV